LHELSGATPSIPEFSRTEDRWIKLERGRVHPSQFRRLRSLGKIETVTPAPSSRNRNTGTFLLAQIDVTLCAPMNL